MTAVSRIALLIDAENLSYRDLPLILDRVATQGQIILKAIYGDWRRPDLQKWRETAEANGLTLRHQMNVPNTKNSSDMKLIMDAVEVLHFTTVDTFCLVTNDADYVALCHKLQGARKHVIGMGYPHAAEAFIRACDQFIFLRTSEPQFDLPPSKPAANGANGGTKSTRKLADAAVLRQIIATAFDKLTPSAGGWVSLSAFGATLTQVQPGFQANAYGFATLTKLLTSLPDYVELKDEAAGKVVRLKPPLAHPPPAR